MRNRAAIQFVTKAEWRHHNKEGQWAIGDFRAWKKANVERLQQLLRAMATMSASLGEVQLDGVVVQMLEVNLGDDQLQAVAADICSIGALAHVNLSDCRLTERGATHINRVLQHCGSMDLSLNSLHCQALPPLMKSIPSGHVRFLDLSDTDIRGSACITLAAACKADGALCKIEDLRLCSNSIGDKGCVVLLDELKNCSSLQYLDLRDAGLTCWGGSVDAVARLVACGGPALDCVRLCRNGVHDEGAVALAASLQTQKQKVKITLNNAKIGDQGAKEILKLVRENKCVNVSIKDNMMGAFFKASIEEVVSNNFNPPKKLSAADLMVQQWIEQQNAEGSLSDGD